MEISKIREKLISLAEPEYGDFVAKGAPGSYPVLGVRLPNIQKLADEILKGDYQEFLDQLQPQSREEMHLKAFVLAGKIKRDGLDKTELFRFLEQVDTWENVDTLVARLKVIKKDRESWIRVVDEMLKKSEFFARTGLVILLDYYIESDWIQILFERILEVKDREEYYVRMAVAWTLQKCFAKFPDLTFGFMRTAELPDWVLRRAVSKIRDSYQIDDEWKKRASSLLK
ncbi:DNA alkylation repair protein [Candidatus Saccharibacteria bacterium]|nr:DNA alkylation repair protein [Candidatus Saccharibacteria bacterium]